jgi:O-antigen/teichoic acid export membrane protein
MKRQIATGAAWMIFMRLCDRLLGLVSTLILARLLLPSDFGLVAMAMSFIALIELAGAFSFEVALIQRAEPTRAHYDTAWTMNLGFALMCAAITALMGPVAAVFYDEPRLTLLMALLAIGWAISGFENIGVVNFRRQMNFAREFQFMFGKRLAGFVVTLVLAFLWRSYWALVVGQTTVRCVGVLLSFLMEPYRPRLSIAARRDLLSFSGWLLVNNALNFALSRFPHFLVGKVSGPGALGIYTVSTEFARLPSTELSAPINRAAFAGLARLTHDPAELNRIFAQVVGASFALTLPASVGLAMISSQLVQVILGANWSDAAPVLAIVALAGAIEGVSANFYVAFLVSGKPRLLAGFYAFRLAMLVAFAALLVPSRGILGMALAELSGASLSVFVGLIALLRVMSISLRDLASAMWRTLFASAIMAGALHAMFGLPHDAPEAPHTSWVLLLSVGTGAATYVAALFALWWISGRPVGAESVVLSRAHEVVRPIIARWRLRQ